MWERVENWGWWQTVPVPGDYDGDGITDLAVYHPQTGMWYIVESGSGQIIEVWWGWREAVPVCVQNTINRWYRLTP